MRRKETGQFGFDIDLGDSLSTLTYPGKPVLQEQESRIRQVITFSQIEKIIYQDIEKIPPRNIFDASLVIGIAIDKFLVPANFIYRYRDNYCFDENQYPEWNLKTVFANFFPTGFEFGQTLALLEKHRPSFIQNNPLYPANSALERRNIKKALIPLWEEVARNFKLDSLHLQNIMAQDGGFLLPSGRTATGETITQIGQRIVKEKFDTLVDDDKNYTYLAKPDCLLKLEVDGQDFNILVQPDYIKRLRERQKTVAKRRIVIKRIVGDFKNSDKKDLTDFNTPFGKVMLVYNLLLSKIGQNFKQNQLEIVRMPDGRKRRVFQIPEVARRPIPQSEVGVALEFLQEEGGEIFSQMPVLTEELQQLAKITLERAIRISQTVSF